MNRLLLAPTLATLTLLATGCGHAALRGADAPEAAARTALAKAPADGAAKDAELGLSDEATPALARAAGDFIVYRFSGSFRKAPLTLTQRVVSRDGMTLVVDMTLEGAGNKTALRVSMSDAPATRGEIVSVARLEGGAAREATIALYDKMMTEVALAADQNEENLGTEDASVEIAGATLAVKRVSYRVKVGKREATLRTLEKDGFAWGDLGGEITAKDGTVLYRAEVIDMGHAAAAKDAALAHTDTDE